VGRLRGTLFFVCRLANDRRCTRTWRTRARSLEKERISRRVVRLETLRRVYVLCLLVLTKLKSILNGARRFKRAQFSRIKARIENPTISRNVSVIFERIKSTGISRARVGLLFSE